MTILAVQEKAKHLRPDVQKQCTYPTLRLSCLDQSKSLTLTRLAVTLLYTALGREVRLHGIWPPSPEDHAHMAQFLSKTPELVATGQVKPNPIKLWEGGLDGIADGLQYMREGKNSGEKIVYRIA